MPGPKEGRLILEKDPRPKVRIGEQLLVRMNDRRLFLVEVERIEGPDLTVRIVG